TFPAGDARLTTVTFGHRSGKLIATGSEDNIIHIYVVGQSTSVLTLTCQTTAISALRFSTEENMLASGSLSGALKLCDLESQKIIHPGGHKAAIRCIEYFPSSNNFLVTGSVDGIAKLWDQRQKGFLFNYKGHNGAINSLKFSPDGRYLTTAADDAAIRMWDVKGGRFIKDLLDHQGPVNTIEYHPKELLLASGSSDKRIKFWDLDKYQTICETPQELSAIKCLAFDPDNASYLFSGSNDMLRVYNWEPVQLLDTVTVGWKNVQDIVVHKDQLLGASVFQNKVTIGSVYIPDLKTKPRKISPVRDYFPNDLKTTANMNSTSRRTQFQPIATKDENMKVRQDVSGQESTLDASSQSSSDDFKQPQPTDSVVIDNMEDYDRIFRSKNHLSRSPTPKTTNNNSKSTVPAPSSASTGTFTINSSTTNTENSAQPSTKGSNPRTTDEIFSTMTNANRTITSVQEQRLKNLQLLSCLSGTTSTQTTLQAVVASHDLSLECLLLRFVIDKLSRKEWNLELCASILPAIRDLLKSHHHWYNLTACHGLEKILSGFGTVIYDNVTAKSIGVDLSQQARYLFYLQIKNDIIEQRLHVPDNLISDLFALIVQAEVGDYTTEHDSAGYISELIRTDENENLEKAVMDKHKQLRGTDNRVAQQEFLSKAKWLDFYGVDLYQACDENNMNINSVGLSTTGISLYRDMKCISSYFCTRKLSIHHLRKSDSKLRSINDDDNHTSTNAALIKSQSSKRHSLKEDSSSMGGGTIYKNDRSRTDLNSTTVSTNDNGGKSCPLKKQQNSSSSIVRKVIFLDSDRRMSTTKHDDSKSKRRSIGYSNESESDQRNFVKLTKEKNRSINELAFCHDNKSSKNYAEPIDENKRSKSSPEVNYLRNAFPTTSHETTTCDEYDNGESDRQKKSVVRRRKRSKSPKAKLPSEIKEHIEFKLVDPVGLNENQLKDIPYTKVETMAPPFRISISPHSNRKRRTSPFGRTSDVVQNAPNNLPYRGQPVVSVAQVKSTKIINIARPPSLITQSSTEAKL
ncbi:unnamed protein product, partial [Didymodactylos carnosus]